MSSYRETFDASISDPDTFWREAAGLVDWFSRADTRARPVRPAVLPLVH